MNFQKFFGLDKYIKTGKNDDISNCDKVIADLYESFLGAVYIEYGLEKVRKIVLDVLVESGCLVSKEFYEIEKKVNVVKKSPKAKLKTNKKTNYKTLLRGIVGKKSKIQYIRKFESIETYIIDLEINKKIISQGKGNSLESAKKDAVKKACEKIIKDELKYTVDYKSLIKKIAGKNATIRYVEERKKSDVCIVYLMINDQLTSKGKGKNLKEAKKNAAKIACQKLVKS